ncbi:nuclear transport factor 2 family protein [Novosphingobium sp. JCM 18896]|uniref:nuclear transport factor 2 family protein n=1 Tax=Novosphingobium sp. JCM 18896 TaxID=2989731 RepID=UPI00222338B9|nr:nuclear transport factor 2 family protein [Novosphingobium sp. JCM 18896]MCW1428540.1 nuclear transport factor 2 family protein [Novosphingobium sp. JCM 18896]
MSNLATAEAMIAAYNAQDVDTYVSYMTDDACEANYRGAVVREGKEGTRSGLAKAFAVWPENKAEIREKQEIGNYVLFREYVTRGPSTDGSPLVEPFEVVAIYTFEGAKCARVEFVR